MATGVGYPDELIPLMEMRLHMEPVPQHIFWQFVMEKFDFTARPGDTIRVEGPNFLAASTAPDTDHRLANLSVRLDAQTTQAFTLNKQEITLEEYMLINPLQLKEYDVKHSIHDLAEINGSILAEDHNAWQDAIIRKRFTDNTYRSYVNNKGTVNVMAAADVFSTDSFIKAAAKLATRLIPRFPDGNYIAIIDEQTQATLLQEQKFLDATTRGQQNNAAIFTGELGVYGGIRFIRSNNIPTTAGGSSGVAFTASQSFIFGTSTFGLFPMGSAEGLINKTRTDFIRGFGAGPVVQLVGMPVEVREREVTDYKRFQEVTWIEHSRYSVLDPNPGAGKTVGLDTRFAETLFGATNILI